MISLLYNPTMALSNELFPEPFAPIRTYIFDCSNIRFTLDSICLLFKISPRLLSLICLTCFGQVSPISSSGISSRAFSRSYETLVSWMVFSKRKKVANSWKRHWKISGDNSEFSYCHLWLNDFESPIYKQKNASNSYNNCIPSREFGMTPFWYFNAEHIKVSK